MAIQLRTSTGSLTKVTVRLRRRAGKVVDTVRLARVSTPKRRAVLRVNGKMPGAGRYMVLAARGGRTRASTASGSAERHGAPRVLGARGKADAKGGAWAFASGRSPVFRGLSDVIRPQTTQPLRRVAPAAPPASPATPASP